MGLNKITIQINLGTARKKHWKNLRNFEFE